MIRAWLSLFLMLWLASTAYASGDIVYSARYYYPPGTKGTSHFHLYRINPNGTGRQQITYGNSDETNPQWSPDGQLILFDRDYFTENGDAGHAALCLISVQGGLVTKLLDMGNPYNYEWMDVRWSPDGHTISIKHETVKNEVGFSSIYLLNVQTKRLQRLAGLFAFDWSHDGKHAITSNDNGFGIYDLNSGKIVTLKDYEECPIWIDNRTVADFAPPDAQTTMTIQLLGLDGQKRMQVLSRFTKVYPGSKDESIPSDGFLLATPDPQRPIYIYNAHTSTVPVDYVYFQVNLKTQKMRYFTEGQFLAWSPDGKRFCTAPPRDTVPYEKRRYPQPYITPGSMEAKYRMVWNAPLYIRKVEGGPMRQLTPRLSWVTGADWRKIPKDELLTRG